MTDLGVAGYTTTIFHIIVFMCIGAVIFYTIPVVMFYLWQGIKWTARSIGNFLLKQLEIMNDEEKLRSIGKTRL